MIEEKEKLIDRDIQEAKYFASFFLTFLDKFYPTEILLKVCPRALKIKSCLRKEVLDSTNELGRYLSESRKDIE